MSNWPGGCARCVQTNGFNPAQWIFNYPKRSFLVKLELFIYITTQRPKIPLLTLIQLLDPNRT